MVGPEAGAQTQQLKELVLRCRVDSAEQELIRSIAKKWHPRICITKLDRSMMDVPLPNEAAS